MLGYDDVGSGVPLVLLHGFPLDRTIWEHQLEGLRDVARLVAPDLRGFGASGDAAGVMTMDEYAADVEALLGSLGIGRAVVCGLSMGGYVALALLARSRELVGGLVLANTRSGSDDEAARRGRQAAAAKALEGEVPAIADAMLPKMFAPATFDERPDLVERVHRMMAGQRSAAVAAALLGMADRPDRTPLLEALDLPTLVITGSDDTLIPVSESESMATATAGAELVVIPGAGHLSNLEQPQRFNAAVREFLQPL